MNEHWLFSEKEFYKKLGFNQIGFVLKRFFTKKNLLVIAVVGILAFLFIWFAYLPKKQKSGCSQWALDKAREVGFHQEVYDSLYKICLRNKGL